MAGYGGETPLIDFALSMTVEGPTGTNAATPVEQGDLFKLGGTAYDGTGYKAAALAAGDDATSSVVLMALHRATEVGTMGVMVVGGYRGVVRFNYVTGAAPTIGQSIEASAVDTRKVAGKAFARGDGYVLSINTANLTVEVLV